MTGCQVFCNKNDANGPLLPTHYNIAQDLFDLQMYEECIRYIEELQIPLDEQLLNLLETCRLILE